ncbi:heme-binding protein [Mycobacterium sp.]|uniref:SOUL family heme-binding protein n=1 Tax=Mycobacterium sp. TaxID=1785 RepID=UPI0031D7E172
MLGAIARVTKQLIEAGESIVGVRHGTEEPAYTVEQRTDGVEIRRYGPRIAAETTVTAGEEAARSKGFRRLAGYIFGGNHTDTKIAMTAPVAQQSGAARGEKIAMTAPVAQQAEGDDEWVIRFFMPAGKTMESLPQPDNPAVRLVAVPGETIAVRRFTGSRSRSAIAAQTAALMRTLGGLSVQPVGEPVAWFYDPPWTVPMLRRNEVAVPVKPNH